MSNYRSIEPRGAAQKLLEYTRVCDKKYKIVLFLCFVWAAKKITVPTSSKSLAGDFAQIFKKFLQTAPASYAYEYRKVSSKWHEPEFDHVD